MKRLLLLAILVLIVPPAAIVLGLGHIATLLDDEL